MRAPQARDLVRTGRRPESGCEFRSVVGVWRVWVSATSFRLNKNINKLIKNEERLERLAMPNSLSLDPRLSALITLASPLRRGGLHSLHIT